MSCGKKDPVHSTHSTSSYSSTSMTSKEKKQESTEQTSQSSNVEDKLNTYLQQFKDENIGIYVEEIDSGKTFSVNENQPMYAASIAKLPIIYYTQLRLLSGSVTKEDMFPYIDEVNNISGAMIRGGTGVMQQTAQIGQYFSIGQLLEWTIKNSDNLACNMLGYYVADKNSGDFLSAISPYYSSPMDTFNKEMTPKTAGLLMKQIYHNKVDLDDFLHTQWQKEKIGHLDKDVYHKIGTNGEYNHDVGVVMSDKPYVISILTNGYSNEEIESIVKEIDTLIKLE